MLIHIKGAHIVDPANQRDEIGDLWIRDDAIVAPPQDGAKADETVDANGLVAMAGGIDIHSHIAGANVNTARLMLPEQHRAHARRPASTPLSNAGWSTFETGCLYAEMGFTTVVEPAVAPHHALHAHLELADTPIIDKAILTLLGNDDFVLGLMRAREGASAIRDHVAWTLQTTRALGIKVVNAGGVAAFKENMRSFSFDDVVPSYGVTSRAIVKALQKAVHEAGVPHPLHVHCNNLGLPGNVETALTTIAAADDLPLHLAHLQFYGYGKEGPQGFSSAAPRLAEAVNAAKTVTIDVGQVMFGQTVTISSDVLRQFSARGQARPKKYAIVDGDFERRRHRALRISRGQLSQRGAIRRRVGAVPAYRRPLARVLHHRPPERRAVHELSRDIRAADGQGCAGRVGSAPAERGGRGDDAAVADARIHVERDCDDDARGPGQAAWAFPIAGISALARAPMSRFIARARISRRCSGRRLASTRTAISSCATAR